ncbi:MAG: glutamine-hydrolyzing carbamoyl-phosphate synthase small subunit [Clostridiales Family XIII bacterium]|jgi:carbamoyl-phosphate synthase small subunit|nr:glutamine-hydrolyzing carbamoyl-phosphate synthase small subunit [Clostridiales Family XIII bacterium]
MGEEHTTTTNTRGLLYLEDGTVFHGRGFGARGTRVGELVFNTSMTGYQKILTDPSYKGQIINMTYPLIGNYGVNDDDYESLSRGIHAFGFVAKGISACPSNNKSRMTIHQWLTEQGVPGVCGVDTRMITKKIRDEGTVKCLISNEGVSEAEAREICEGATLRQDWMKETAVKEPLRRPGKGRRLAVMDFGIKAGILTSLSAKGCDLHLFPYGASAEEIMAVRPEGIFLSNGPGDPEEAVEGIETARRLIGRVPIFGICMGHQVLALALGGKTYKMKYGHRGGNHGVHDADTDRSAITSQNHGYAVDAGSAEANGLIITHRNLNDGTVEGMKHKTLPLFSVQFHPEASPGPNDSAYLFDRFLDMIARFGGAD